MSAVTVQHFLRRAKDFEYSMKLCSESSLNAEIEFPVSGLSRNDESLQSAALLGIHAAISYADALRTALGDTELSLDDHQLAEKHLRRVLIEQRVKEEELRGITRFGFLVGKKSAIAYGKNRINATELKSIVDSCQRFSVWINRLGKQLNAEGWTNAATN